MRKPAFCICENKDADQLCGDRTADQRLCFRYIDTAIPLLSKTSSVAVHPGLCRTWSDTPKTCFLTTRLISKQIYVPIIRVEYLNQRTNGPVHAHLISGPSISTKHTKP